MNGFLRIFAPNIFFNMKLPPEDSQLTAYVLGEIEPDEAASIESAAAEDPNLRQKIHEIKDIQRFLKERLAKPDEQLHPRQYENVKRNARMQKPATEKLSLAAWKDRLLSWFIPAAAIAVITFTTFVLMHMSAKNSPPIVKPTNVGVEIAQSSIQTQAPAVTPEPAPLLSSFAHPGFLTAKDCPVIEIPIITGCSKISELEKIVLVENKFPKNEEITVEEIINSFPLRLNGVSSIARDQNNLWHPDDREKGKSSHFATLSTEMIACPWRPSSTLLLISIRANTFKDCDIKISFQPNPENVSRYRLLGFTSTSGRTFGSTPTRLSAGAYTSFAIEIVPSNAGTNLGSFTWSGEGQPAPTISLIHKADAELSDDARFATLVCTYALWLTKDPAETIDKEIVAALTRETTSVTLPPERKEFIKLIERTLQL
jgi:hypothetical protein